MPDNVETITIPMKLYKELLSDSLELQALGENGVDNWDWYSEAMDTFKKLKKEHGLA